LSVTSNGNFPRRLRPHGLSEYRKIDDATAGDAVNVAGNYGRDGFYWVRGNDAALCARFDACRRPN